MSQHVIENVTRLREALNLSREALHERLKAVGRPIRATGLARLEAGKRRVDADDLVALALALGVSPVRLLMPPGKVDVVALTDEREVAWQAAWRWMVGEQPLMTSRAALPDPDVLAFIEENRPFELQPWIREAARGLVAREHAPFRAEVTADAAGKVKHEFTYVLADDEAE